MAELGIAIITMAAGILRELAKISSDVRNGQDEWEHFRTVMTRLSDQLDEIKEEIEGNPAIKLKQIEHDQIKQLLKECKDFLDERPNSLPERIGWALNPNNKEKLRGHRDKVNEIFIQVINQFWHRTAPHRALQHQAQPDPGPSQPERASTGSVDTRRSFSGSSSTTASCYVAGAEVVEKKEVPTETIIAKNFERLNIKVKLFLDKNLEKVTELIFDKFHYGMDKDSGRAILDLRAPNRSGQLTQIGSAGWIPITSKRCPLEAIILSPASLTDHDGGTKEVHQSRFSFENSESRKRFQECLRGRKLLGEFKTKKITVSNSVRALSQLIQVWSGNWRSTARISYHDSITKKCQDLEYIEAKLPKKGREVVDLRSRFPKIDPAIQITFMKSADAEAFMEIFNSHRLMAPSLPDPVPRPPSPTTTIGTSSAYSSRTSVSSFSKEWLSQFGNG